MSVGYGTIIEQYQWNTQIVVLLGFSLLSSLIAVFATIKCTTKYSLGSFLAFVFNNLLLLSSFTTLIVSSVYLVKINAVDGITVTVLPSWAIPWWSIITMFGIINTFITVCYSCLVLLSRVLVDEKSGIMSDVSFINSMIRDKYRTKYTLVSLTTLIALIIICVITFLCAVLLCDPGKCQ